MKAGDLVRFKPPYYIAAADGVLASDHPAGAPWYIGLLVEYEKTYKIAVVYYPYHEELLRVASYNVEKAGIKDELSRIIVQRTVNPWYNIIEGWGRYPTSVLSILVFHGDSQPERDRSHPRVKRLWVIWRQVSRVRKLLVIGSSDHEFVGDTDQSSLV